MSLIFPINPDIGTTFFGYIWDGAAWNRIARAGSGGSNDPFVSMTLNPVGVSDNSIPTEYNVKFIGKNFTESITAASVVFAGQATTLSTDTPVSGITARGGFLTFTITDTIQTQISNNITNDVKSLNFDLTLTLSGDADPLSFRFPFYVNNPSIVAGGVGSGGLNQAAVDARVRAVANKAYVDGLGVDYDTLTDKPDITGLIEAGVLDWAETGNTDTIPPAKIAIDTNELVFQNSGRGPLGLSPTVESRIVEGVNAHKATLQHSTDIASNRGRIDSLERTKYAAWMTVNPPNVRQHSGFQRKFQSTLSWIDPHVETYQGSTGTRPTNTFRIFTELSDGTVVQLHTQGWSGTVDTRQSISWDVSAAEFNQLGTSVSTTGIEVWGEFRAIYGGGVDESRGATNRVFIDFGEEGEWPATRGELAVVDNTVKDNFGIISAARVQVTAGYEFTGYATTLPAGGLVTGHMSEAIGGVYTATVRTDPLFPSIRQGASYFSQVASGNPSVPRYVIIDDRVYGVKHNTGRFYEILDFAGFTAGNTYRIQIIFTNGRKWIQDISTAQQISWLNLVAEPTGILFKSVDDLTAAVKRIDVRISNPELLTDDVWVEGWIQGQPTGRTAADLSGLSPTGVRTKWTSTTSTFVMRIGDTAASSVSGGVLNDPQLECNLRFFDAASGGNEVERRDVFIPLTNLVKLDATTLGGETSAQIQAPGLNALTSAAAVTWNVDNGEIGTMTVGHNFTLTITGGVNGQMALLRTLQDTTGSRTMTLDSKIVLDGRTAPVLPTAASSHANNLFMKRGSTWVWLGQI